VGACLCNNLNSIEYTITYWWEGSYEIDYVVAKGADIRAIEVKSGACKKLSGPARFHSFLPGSQVTNYRRAGYPAGRIFQPGYRTMVGLTAEGCFLHFTGC